MLAKLEKGVIGELLKISCDAAFKGGKDVKASKYDLDSLKEHAASQNKELKLSKSIEFQKKIDIVKKTQEILNRHRSKKLSNLSQRTSNGNSKHLLGSKKNT